MRRVPRKRRDGKGRIIAPPESWIRAAKERAVQAVQDGPSHKSDEEVYGHDDARAALEKLFDGKCAYCEQKLDVQWDVEHFRPKGRVHAHPTHPGYYWLAYEWSNLYPSCKACNQKLRDKPLYDEPSAGAASGKADQFPLEDEATRAMKPGDAITDEKRLLIDPCQDNPARYFFFRSNGEIASMNDNKMGLTTITVMNLWRKRLNNDRKAVIGRALEFVKALASLSGNSAESKVRQLARRTLLEDDCVHLTVAEAVFERPEEFGIDQNSVRP